MKGSGIFVSPIIKWLGNLVSLFIHWLGIFMGPLPVYTCEGYLCEPDYYWVDDPKRQIYTGVLSMQNAILNVLDNTGRHDLLRIREE